MIKVLFDTAPLYNGNAGRGVGAYTKFLTEALAKRDDVTLLEKGMTKEADLVHYPFFDLFFATLPLLRSYKTVVTVHDVIPLQFLSEYKPGKKGMVRFFRQRLALQSVNAVITDSEASKKEIIKHLKIKAHKVHVVQLAANPELKPAVDKKLLEVKEKYLLPENYLLYVGDINYNKNLPQLIKALKFLPDEVSLVCVGRNFKPQEIPEWKAIEVQIALSDVPNRVQFVNELSGESVDELSAIYSGATAYVQPSLAEGFGLPVLEAMQCGTPVVCAQNSSLVEVGGDEVVYVQTDAESIATGVKEVLEWSDDVRAKRISSAKKWAKHFTWEKAAEETVKVYQEVLKK
jgi:glycosyltransferase involved in cell wall biosynthesis